MSPGDTVVGYARGSKGATSGVRLEAQQAAIRAECERRGWRLVRVEEDVPGGGEASRPGLARVLAACGAGEARAVVVSRLDRLARSVSDAARLLERAKREGWNLVALDVGLDLSTPRGERVANAFATVAEWERRLDLRAYARSASAGSQCSAPRARRLRPPSPRSPSCARRA